MKNSRKHRLGSEPKKQVSAHQNITLDWFIKAIGLIGVVGDVSDVVNWTTGIVTQLV